jgi:hypothetical protein
MRINYGCTQMNTDKTKQQANEESFLSFRTSSVFIRVHPWFQGFFTSHLM